MFYTAKHYQIEAHGVELYLPLYLFCILKKWITRNKKAHFHFRSLYRQDVSTADLIYVFGMPETMAKRLKGKLEKELKPSAKVVSYSFAIEGWKYEKKDKTNPQTDLSIYLYRMENVADSQK